MNQISQLPFFWLIGAGLVLVVTALLLVIFAPHKLIRIRRSVILFLVCLFIIFLRELFKFYEMPQMMQVFTYLGNLFEILVFMNLFFVIFFNLLMMTLRIQIPDIVSDLIIGMAYITLFFYILYQANVDLSGIVVTSALLTALLSFAIGPTLGNIFSGIALQFDRSFFVGDWIQLDAQTQGKIKAITWRYTAIETRNWDTIIVPNSTLLSGTVTILGQRADCPSQHRMWVYFNVDFRFPPSKVISVVTEALLAAPIPYVAQAPCLNCICMDLGKEGLESVGRYAVRYWLTDLAYDDPTNSLFRERIYFALARAGIPLSISAIETFVVFDDDVHKELKKKREILYLRDLLIQLELFRDLTQEEVTHLAQNLIRAPFAKDEVITQAGKEAHWLYILTQGKVDIWASIADDKKKLIANLAAPNYFGEMSLMTGEPRSATVVASELCECYRLEREAFRKIITERPEIASLLSSVIAQRESELIIVHHSLTLEQQEEINKHKKKLLSQIQHFFGIEDV